MTGISSTPSNPSNPSTPSPHGPVQRPLTSWRLAVSLMAGVAATLVTIFLGNWQYAPSVGWDATGIVFGVWIWRAIWPLSPQQTATRATAEDPSRPIADVIVLTACVASLVALGLVLNQAHREAGAARFMLALLAVVSVAIAWAIVHTIYTLRYARLYYGDTPGGVDFNQAERPAYKDFAYLAFTLGMTYQVSDTSLQSTAFRSSALLHALLSYLFGAVIVAAAVNLIAGLGSFG